MGVHSHGSKRETSSSSERNGNRNRSRRRERSDGSVSGSVSGRGRVITEEEIEAYKVERALKNATRVAEKLKSQSVVAGYSNASNPFGDSNLGEMFVWKKKIERDVALGADLDTFSVKAAKKRLRECMAEIEKGKKRRDERALGKAQHEENLAMLDRERTQAEFQDREKKDKEFHFHQSKVRSEIRLREGRAKAIDILSKQLNGSNDRDIELKEPWVVFDGLTMKEMEELRGDIEMHLDFDTQTPIHAEYWKSLLVVCDWELAEARKEDALDRARARGAEPPAELLAEERGVHPSTEADVRDYLHDKTWRELEHMHAGVETRLHSGTAKVVEFWEVMLRRIPIYKAKAFLKEFHANMLRRHLPHLELPADVVEKIETADVLGPTQEVVPDDQGSMSPEPFPRGKMMEPEEEVGSFSPRLLHSDETQGAVDPEEDRAALERKRMEVQMGAMKEGDAVFGTGGEVNLGSLVYDWQDKYRPRKPKYFNRVHTGYEWNKYNRTHYDHDNPPPKTVQGYKFNIFYPDLVDKTKAPRYFIEKDGNSTETCIIRFHAGPPYEDIAFRIVLKDWEYSNKKGFRCTFGRGILQVYFNVKRYNYRR
ncbi:hypothetical protein ACJRO7_018747 [Eucalyptus globulus]|uniref:Splicing factor Cactin n=1 Tax=Eucalyptus globulus TaxID=34317 RepID=A0ABD3KW49_EUCGL